MSDGTEAKQKTERVLSQFAGKLSEWKDEHHDCDCPPHDGCGCHELRGIIQEMEYYNFSEDDAKAMLAPSPVSDTAAERDRLREINAELLGDLREILVMLGTRKQLDPCQLKRIRACTRMTISRAEGK